MELPDSERYEFSSLNASLTIEPFPKKEKVNHSCFNATQNASLNGLQTEIISEKQLNQNQIPSTKRSGAEGQRVAGVSSYYSSINNLLPCTDADLIRSHTEEGLQTKQPSLETSIQVEYSSRNYSSSASKPRIVFETDRIPLRHRTKPPLNPTEVAKGLSSLHSKIDDLLRKRSLQRAPREIDLPDRNSINEKSLRAQSSDSRVNKHPSQTNTLTQLQREILNVDLPSNRSCYSIAIDGTKQQNELNFTYAMNEYKDNNLDSKMMKTQPDALHDSLIEEKQNSNGPRKMYESPKSRLSLDVRSLLIPRGNPNFSHNDVDSRPQQVIQLPKPLSFNDVGKCQTETSPSCHNSKPKYDEKKLDAIVSKIRERNSVSPLRETRQRPNWLDINSSQRFSANLSYADRSYMNFDHRAPLDNLNSFSRVDQDSRLQSLQNTSVINPSSQAHSTSYIREEKTFNKPSNSSLNSLPEIFQNLKNIQNVKFMRVKTEAGTPQKFMDSAERDKYLSGFNSDHKPRIEPRTELHRNSFTPHKRMTSHKRASETSNQILNIGKTSNDQFCEESQSGTDNVMDRYSAKILRDEDYSHIDVKSFGNKEYNPDELSNPKRQRLPQTGSLFSNINLSQDLRISAKRFSDQNELPMNQSDSSSRVGRLSMDKVEKVNDNRVNQTNLMRAKKEGSIKDLDAQGTNSMRPEKKAFTFLESLDKPVNNVLGEQSPIRQCEDELLTLDGSVFSLKDNSNLAGELDTNRLFGAEEIRAKDSCRPQFNTVAIREKFLEDNEAMSDFDFERNRLETQDQDVSLENEKSIRLKYLNLPDDEKTGIKRQRVSDRSHLSHILLQDANEQFAMRNTLSKPNNFVKS